MRDNSLQPGFYSAMKGIFPSDFADADKIERLGRCESHLLGCLEKQSDRLKRSLSGFVVIFLALIVNDSEYADLSPLTEYLFTFSYAMAAAGMVLAIAMALLSNHRRKEIRLMLTSIRGQILRLSVNTAAG